MCENNPVKKLPRWCAPLWALAFVCGSIHARAQAIDSLISAPDLWQTTRTAFVKQHPNLGFYWLSAIHDRAETHSKNVTFLGKRVYEVDVDFQGDNLGALTVSIYNRGDAGEMGRTEMTTLLQSSRDGLTALTKVPGVYQGQEASDAVKSHEFQWRTPVTNFLLEYSFTKEVKSRNIPFRAEFVSLHVMPVQKPQGFLAQALASASPAGPFNGPSHVKKDANGDVRLATVPMVDQGDKGYCVVASAERVMRYYGIPVDENELAEMANTSATQGTSNEAMFDSLKKLSQRLQVKIRPIERMDVRQLLALIAEYNRDARREHQPPISDTGPELYVSQIYAGMKPDLLKEARTHNKADVDRFQQIVQDHIDQGIPILWSVMFGIMPETRAPTGIGGHMRLIIGYNTQTNEILYTDSWGPGHELKRMPLDNAWTMTMAMDLIEPLEGLSESDDSGFSSSQ
jgi:hypothetical protein